MTKQEQIEEIHNILCKKGFDGEFSRAKFIYNAGYQKIPENAVVLTEEEYIDLSRNYIGEQIAQACKEKAKEILQRLHNWKPAIIFDSGGIIAAEKNFDNAIKALAEECNVEIEE